MSQHTPLIRLQAAQRAFSIAEANCPHWDYESDGDHACCQELAAARNEVRLARKAATETTRS